MSPDVLTTSGFLLQSPVMVRALGVLFVLSSLLRLLAQDKIAPPVQEQLDELKRGQEKILQELQELRSALQQTPARAEVAARSYGPAVLNVGGEPFKGATNAVVAIIQYSDFDCSHCAQFATQSFPQLDEKYIRAGKVKYFFRDFPEPGNAESLLKAKFARCAGEQGRFWQAHDYLFSAKPHLVGNDLSKEAEIIGLDPELLSACLKEQRYSVMIQRSANGAQRMGLQGTPTFFVGKLTGGGDILRVKKMITGSETYDVLRSAVDEVLEAEVAK